VFGTANALSAELNSRWNRTRQKAQKLSRKTQNSFRKAPNIRSIGITQGRFSLLAKGRIPAG
jgi:N-acetylmuramoyl-L-alanine amidase